MRTQCRGIAVVAFCVSAPSAWAGVYDLYRSDYSKGAFCSVIAGACAADPDQENAYFQNPAALTAGRQDWSFDGDFDSSANLEQGVNHSGYSRRIRYLGGVGTSLGSWGAAIAFQGKDDEIRSKVAVTEGQGAQQTFGLTTQSKVVEFRLPLAHRVSTSLSVGLTLSANIRSANVQGSDGTNADYIPSGGSVRWGLNVGAMMQLSPEVRVGSWIRAPRTSYASLSFSTVAFSNIISYQKDLVYHEPWIWAWGTSWQPWQDSRTFLFDLDFIGPTQHGNLLNYDILYSAPGDVGFKSKGRTLACEPRIGYRTPWRQDSLGTAYLGLYYEPARTEGVNSRLHFTGGLSYHVATWLELMGGIDVAREFSQFFVTFR